MDVVPHNCTLKSPQSKRLSFSIFLIKFSNSPLYFSATGRWVTYSGAPGTRVRVSTCTAQIGSGLQVLRSSSQTVNYCSYLVCVKSNFTKPECKSIEFVVDDSAVFWIGLARGPNGATYSFQIEELAVGEPYSNAVDPPFGSNQLSPAAQDIDAARDMIRIVGGAIGGGIALIVIGAGLYIFIQKRRRASLFRR